MCSTRWKDRQRQKVLIGPNDLDMRFVTQNLALSAFPCLDNTNKKHISIQYETFGAVSNSSQCWYISQKQTKRWNFCTVYYWWYGKYDTNYSLATRSVLSAFSIHFIYPPIHPSIYYPLERGNNSRLVVPAISIHSGCWDIRRNNWLSADVCIFGE